MTTSDLFWLAVNAYHEARGESDEGIKAVCHVVLNRCAKSGKPVEHEVLRPWQFSWANGGARPKLADYEALERCFVLSSEAIDEHEAGYTLEGSDHYHADYINTPSWAKGMVIVKKIGKHKFYRS